MREGLAYRFGIIHVVDLVVAQRGRDAEAILDGDLVLHFRAEARPPNRNVLGLRPLGAYPSKGLGGDCTSGPFNEDGVWDGVLELD